MLFYAILSSDCIHSLSPAIQSNVEDLQKLRREEFTSMPQEQLSDAEFENAISRVDVAFEALSLPTEKIQAIKNQTNFAEEELRDVLKKVANLKQNKNEVDEATVYSDLGSVHNHLSDLDKAKECYDLALAIRLEKLGPEHVDVASTYNKLGSVHLHLGDLQLAKEYFDRALAIGLKKLGAEHSDLVTTYNNLGDVHTELGELEQAKGYYDHALAIALKEGAEHDNVAVTYNNLGKLYSDLGELETAKEHLARALVPIPLSLVIM